MTAIKTARQFLERVVVPDVRDSIDYHLDLRRAYHACISLLSLRDWVFEDHQDSDWTHKKAGQPRFKKKTSLEHSLVRFQPSFKYVADIANAAKHKRLERSHTDLWGAANTEIKTIASIINRGALFGSFGLNTTTLNQSPKMADVDAIVVRIDKTDHPVLPHIVKVYEMWLSLMTENNW